MPQTGLPWVDRYPNYRDEKREAVEALCGPRDSESGTQSMGRTTLLP